MTVLFFVVALAWSSPVYADPVLKLMGILRIAPDYKQRMTAALGLARRKDKRAVPALIASLKDSHAMVRGVVASVLGKMGDPRAIPGLEALLASAKEDFIRSQAKEALMALKRPRVASQETRPKPGGAAPRMEASGTMGSIDPNAIQDAINDRMSATTSCFNKEFARLQYLGGKLKLLFRVDTRGRVKWLMLERSDVGSRAVESCVLDAMKRTRFDPPSGGEAEFAIPLAFGGGDPVTVLDASSKEARKLRKTCRKIKRKVGRMPPKLMVTVYIDPAGRVTSAGFSAGGVDISKRLGDALLANLKKLKLGRRSGHHRKLTYVLNCG